MSDLAAVHEALPGKLAMLLAETGRAQDWDDYLASVREWVEWGASR